MRSAPSPAVRSMRHSPGTRPFIVIWEATRACALACRHCRASAGPKRDPHELTPDEASVLMAQVADFGVPPPIFVITGGDPFERPDLADLIKAGRSHGLPVAVSPSGTSRLNRESLVAVRDAGAIALSLSLDGSTATVHDCFRGLPGTFDRTMTGWDEARDLGMKVQINTTITQGNVAQAPEIADLVRRRGAMTWSAFMLVPTGRGSNLDPLTASQTEDLLSFLYDIGHSVPVRTTEGHHFRRVVIQRQVLERAGADHVKVLGLGSLYQALRDSMDSLTGREISPTSHAPANPNSDTPRHRRRPPLNVNAGSGFVFVSHRGDVYPSGFLESSAGNVRERSIREIYGESDLFVGVRDFSQLGGRCGSCEYASICGGSRSRAFATTGDPLAEDPLCNYEPGSFPFAEAAQELIDGTR